MPGQAGEAIKRVLNHEPAAIHGVTQKVDPETT